MTPQNIFDQIAAELGHETDSDVTAQMYRGYDRAREELTKVRGGKLKFLRDTQDVSVAAGTQYSTVNASVNLIRFAWNVTDEVVLEFHDEKAYRVNEGNGYPVAAESSEWGDVTGYMLDVAPSGGYKRIEWVPIPDASITIRLAFWKLLAEITSAEYSTEISDVPRQYHSALEAYTRWYTFRAIGKAPDIVNTAFQDWRRLYDECGNTENDTEERAVRFSSRAETDRKAHRQALGFAEGEY